MNAADQSIVSQLRMLFRTGTATKTSAETAASSTTDTALTALSEPAASATLIGAAGSGKTHTLVQFMTESIQSEEFKPEELLLLTPDRQSATALRDRIVLKLNRPVPGPMARSVGSLAHEIVNEHSIQVGYGPAILMTGGEQDQIFERLLNENSRDIRWPDFLSEDVRKLLGFRTELRDLWLRSVELGIDPATQLAGRASARFVEQWSAAEQFFAEYRDYLRDNSIVALDSATLVARAIDIIAAEEFDEHSRIAKLRLLLIDDGQETVHTTQRLLQAFVDRGVRLLVAGNPDQMTARFRGATPEFVGQLANHLHAPLQKKQPLTVQEFALTGQHRFGQESAAALAALVTQIGPAGSTAQRRINARPETENEEFPSTFRVQLADNAHTEVQLIASELREAYFMSQDPAIWNQMAVIVRSRGQIPPLIHELSSLGIPVRYGAAQGPLRDDPLARNLLTLAAIRLGIIDITAHTVAELLTGPIGAFERHEWRNLRRLILFEELGETEARPVDDVLIEMFAEPRLAEFLPKNASVTKLQRLLENLHAADPETETIEELLWGFWDRSKLAKPLQEASAGTGITATAAGSSLDAVVALFVLAAREVEREQHSDPRHFVQHLLETDLPEDNLAPKYEGPSVTLLTPNAALGQEYRHTVIAGLQEGVWPNPTIRDSLFGATELVERLNNVENLTEQSISQKRHDVLQDEMRMFVQAISRSSHSVLITAIDDAEAGVSPFIYALIDSVKNHPFQEETPHILTEEDVQNLTLRKMVAESRKTLTKAAIGEIRPHELTATAEPSTETHRPQEAHHPDEAHLSNEVEGALETLRQLAEAGVPGASPEEWYGILEQSTEGPLHDATAKVRISPSTLEKFQEHPIAWAASYLGGEKPNNTMTYGTLLHEIFENPGTDLEPEILMNRVKEQFSRLHFEADWLREKELHRAAGQIERMSNYLKRARDRQDRVAYAEEPFEIAVDRAVLSGTIDRVEERENGDIVVIDLKTGEAPSVAQISGNMQLSSYQYAIQKEALADIDPTRLVGATILALGKTPTRDGMPKTAEQALKTAEEHEEFGELLLVTAEGMSQAFFLTPVSNNVRHDMKYKNALIHILGTVSD